MDHQQPATAAPEKPPVYPSLLIFTVISAWLFVVALTLIAMDIQAGALRGEPETGWGFAISLFFIGPPFVLSLIISLTRLYFLRRQGKLLKPTFKLAAICAAGLLMLSIMWYVPGL